MTAFLAEYGPALLDKGYPIIPIRAGFKHPQRKGWQSLQADADQLDAWIANGYADGGVGVLCREVPGVDLDVNDPDVVDQLVDWCDRELGVAPRRIGEAPRTLLAFRAEAPFRKLQSTKYTDFLDREHKVEILGDGQQFVAYAVHPGTGQPYQWVGEGLADIKRDDLPVLTVEDAKRLIEYFESIVPDDWEPVAGTGSLDDAAPASGDPFENFAPKVDLTTKQIEIALSKLDPDMPMAEWVKVGMGCHHQFDGTEEGFQLWDAWSANGVKYAPNEMRARWRSFQADLRRGRPTTFATALKWAQEAHRLALVSQSATQRSFDLLPVSAVLARLGPVDWRVRGYLETDTVGVLFGDPGAFKSFIALDLAFHVAAGRDWHGAEVRQGSVVYVAGEGHNGLARRYAAWSRHTGVSIDDLPFFTSNRATDFYNAETAQTVAAAVDQVAARHGAPALIVIDTLAKNFTGDENSAADIGAFISNIDQLLRQPYGATVIVVHHTGHGAKDRGRGSAAMKGGVDFEYMVEKAESGLRTRLKNTRMKDGPDGHETWFEAREIEVGEFDGEFVGSLAMDKIDAPVAEVEEARGPVGPKQKALFELIQNEQPVARETLFEIAISEGMFENRTALRSCLRHLLKNEHVQENEKYISTLEDFPEDEQ